MTKRELLVFIGDGEYGSDLPTDEGTDDQLAELVREGLVQWEDSRFDDFFCITKAGRDWLRANSPADHQSET